MQLRGFVAAAIVVVVAFTEWTAAAAVVPKVIPGCGARDVYFVACIYRAVGGRSLTDVVALVRQGKDGSASLADIQRALGRLGIQSVGRRLSVAELHELRGSIAILAIADEGAPHFAVYVPGRRLVAPIRLIDPPHSSTMTDADLGRAWKGIALLVPVPSLSRHTDVLDDRPIRCDEPEKHFGVVVRPTKLPLKAAFVVRNISDHVLRIGTPIPSCGCTKVSIDEQRLEPGATARIVCTMDTAGDQPGAKVVTIGVPVVGSPRSPLILRLEANFVDLVATRPTHVYFGRVPAGSGTARADVEVYDGELGHPAARL